MKKPRASAPPIPPPERRVVMCVIGAPHGVRGECRVKSYAGDPLAIADYGPLFSGDGRIFEILDGRLLKDDMLVVKFAGMTDRDVVKTLTGIELFIDRVNLPPPEDEDEFYHADLVGLAVVDLAGEAVGTLLAIHDYGAGDFLEICPAEGDATWLQPFTRAGVPVIDLAARRITIDAALLTKPDRRKLDPEAFEPDPPLAGKRSP